MIEIPRAALTADEIALEAEFFSFGTNDLTQLTFGFSRDDSGKFLKDYYDKKIFETEAFLGRNGVTTNKKEGDLKTPIGSFNLGIAFGIHDIQKELQIPYIQINENLYWVDDVNSRYYNLLVDVQKVSKDWGSAEHLSDYPRQYEYAMEIKTNPLPGRNGRYRFSNP